MSTRLEQLEELAKGRSRRMQEEFETKVNELKGRIIELDRKKSAIRDGKVSRAEAIQRMKEDLEKGLNSWIVERFVQPTLRVYGSGHFRPLESFEHMKTHLLHNTEWLFFIFSWISPEMIDRAAQMVEDGPDAKTRAKMVADLDKQIQDAEKELEALLR